MLININRKTKILGIFSLKNQRLSAVGIVMQIFFGNSFICYRKAIRISNTFSRKDNLKAAGTGRHFLVKLEGRTINGLMKLLVMGGQHIVYHEPECVQDIGLPRSIGAINNSRLQIAFVPIRDKMLRMLIVLAGQQG